MRKRSASRLVVIKDVKLQILTNSKIKFLLQLLIWIRRLLTFFSSRCSSICSSSIIWTLRKHYNSSVTNKFWIETLLKNSRRDKNKKSSFLHHLTFCSSRCNSICSSSIIWTPLKLYNPNITINNRNHLIKNSSFHLATKIISLSLNSKDQEYKASINLTYRDGRKRLKQNVLNRRRLEHLVLMMFLNRNTINEFKGTLINDD